MPRRMKKRVETDKKTVSQELKKSLVVSSVGSGVKIT